MEFRLIEHGVVDSTSERAFAALAAGAARNGDVHCAVAQTAGRGRRGARWESPAGEGLYLSVVLLPSPPAPHPAALTIAGGLAVFDAVASLGVGGARLKWPNDLLVGDAKLAGVLVETRGLDPQAPHAVLGVGLDVAQRGFPAQLLAERAVTSLALLGVEVTLAEARAQLLRFLGPRLDQALALAPQLAADFLAAARLAGQRVRVELPDGPREGLLVGLSFESGLALRAPGDGTLLLPVEHVRAVEVTGARS